MTGIRQLLLHCLALIAILCGSVNVAAHPDLDDFDQNFARILSEHNLPGGSYVVVDQGRIVQAAGHGVRASGKPEPVGVDTVFRVASVSKTFAAQLAALLVSEGNLRWEDPVTGYVPEFSLARPEHASQLRLDHLLSQSTGIVPNAYDNLLNASQSLDQIVPRFRELEPMCAPGRCYTYQNVLFALVGPAIEQATGRTYDDLLGERIFRPLDMHRASTGMQAFLDSNDRAWPHVRRGKLWFATDVNENYYRVSPAAGVNASALDLGQWLLAQMGHRPDVIPPHLLGELTEKRIHTARELRRRGWRDLLTEAHYGLGWRIYTAGNEEIVLHSGWVRGFVAEVAYSPRRGIGLGVLLNAESSALNEITTGFWRSVLEQPLMVDHEPYTPAGSTSASAPSVPGMP
jgi:beta-lactamase class C